MLDFDFLCGKDTPDLVAIIATGKKYVRLFWGDDEVLIPVYQEVVKLPYHIKQSATLFLNLTSGRRTLSSTVDILNTLPHIAGGAVFAENVPEKHALEIYSKIKTGSRIKSGMTSDQFIVGPATVGLMVPGHLKLGAIGGTQADQLIDSHLFESGNTAVFSSSGGMTNELIQIVTRLQKRISFALSFGGDRFPVLSPVEAFLAAEADTDTEQIVYFGELGGYDEYDLIDLIKKKRITKKIIAYIGGTISEMFETPPQFGHAKAMASRGEETAQAKTKALQDVGVLATNSFTEFIEYVKKIKTKETNIPHPDGYPHVKRALRLLEGGHKNDLPYEGSTERSEGRDVQKALSKIQSRSSALFMNSISRDVGGSVEIVGEEILAATSKRSYGHIVGSMLLGRQLKSKDTAAFVELVMKLLVDHGPYVSGAVNTMIAARAGKDLVSSLASGILTIGPRFGGAINQAAAHWFAGVSEEIEPHEYVEHIAKTGNRISGIGHRKYRTDMPDPRVGVILEFTRMLKKSPHSTFAKNIEKVTTTKKANLILNVDGAIAAVLLDLLTEKENISQEELHELINIEFFNALFVLSRSVGFTAHYLDQRRLDEGLFRLSPKEIGYIG
ncbi:MAG: citrate/2-methylcitrate synthase [Candidatus Roizmanbacteria bacterium]|nr:citrate/2-methylcitrate synthase [Candidatus Roizmanbacteria bacterium]